MRKWCLWSEYLAFAAVVLGSAVSPWRQAAPAYRFHFPQDHASHPEYKLEWWYYTGNLASAAGHEFGYQLTFFRLGVDYRPENPSRWAVRDLYMAHLAVSDITGKRYRFAEHLNRSGPGWAGADTREYHLWNAGWEAGLDARGQHRLRGAAEAFGLDLDLDPGKPPVLQGDRGYSRKGSSPGNGSNYYSLTRMPTRGTIWIEGERAAVEGLSWMDHEFGTTYLEERVVGWDWFSIQLEDGTDLMFFDLRRSDGSTDPYSSGTLVDALGRYQPIGATEFTLEPSRFWRSAASGARYPLEWRIGSSLKKMELRIGAALEDQELRTPLSGVTYWEGSVTVEGIHDNKQVGGRGYLEMTGYAGPPMGSDRDKANQKR